VDFRSFNAQFLGLTVDALTSRALGVNGVVEGAIAIQRDALNTAQFPVDILDTAFAFGELLVVAERRSLLWKEQRALEPLRTVARGLMELDGRMPAQPLPTPGHRIGIAGSVGVFVERDSSKAAMTSGSLVNLPRIESGISGHMGGEATQSHD
jgi:hypothetical protein